MDQTPKRPPLPSHGDSKPAGDRASIEVDKTVGAAKSYAASQDHVRPELARKGTLTGLQAVRPAALKPTLSGLPAPPPLPLEHQATIKAPAQPPLRKTWRLPTPPSALAHARRSDPPLPLDPMPTSARVPGDETPPVSQRKPSPLPAPSQRPEEARAAALARDNARLRQERDEARAMAPRERQPSYRDIDDDSVVRHRLETLERDRDKLEMALPRLEGEVAGIKLEVANVASEVKSASARSSSETTKIIVAGIVTVVTAVVGSRLTTPDQKPVAAVVQKSEAEIEAEVCGKLADPQEKSICLTGVLNRMVEPAKR